MIYINILEFHGPIGPEILALSGLGSDCSEAFYQSTNGDIQCSTLQFHIAMVKPFVHLTFSIHILQSKYYSEILKQIVDSSVHYCIFISTEGN